MNLRMLSLFFISVFGAFFAAIAFAENNDENPLSIRIRDIEQIRELDRIGSPKRSRTDAQKPKLVGNKNRLIKNRLIDLLAGLSMIPSNADNANFSIDLTGRDIAQLIAPNEDINLAIAYKVKEFPYRLDTYVAIVCFAKSQFEYIRAMQYDSESCQKDPHFRDDVIYLGLIEYKSGNSKPRLIAKSLKIEAGWRYSWLHTFRKTSRKNGGFLPYGEYTDFDFAPFKINNSQTAFGLRILNSGGYSGGFGYFESLALFMIDEDRVNNIFAQPMYLYLNLRGEGYGSCMTVECCMTVERVIYEGENVLVVLPSQTDGYYDLQIKALDNEWEKTFSWDSSLKRYLPSDRTAILNRVLAETLNLRVD